MMRTVRFVQQPWTPYDPLKLATYTEKIVIKGESRKYTEFYAVGVYRGIATGYAVGCPFRCIYCWSSMSRDFPERFGKFYSPLAAVRALELCAVKWGVRKARISGCEPTLGKSHLIPLLHLIEQSETIDLFILETNGLLFGVDERYVREIANLEKVYVRICIKAIYPESFERVTGAIGKYVDLPFKAIEYLYSYGLNFHVAAMTDPRIMSSEERYAIIKRLNDIAPQLTKNLEEEVIDPYPTTVKRLRYAGIDMEL